MKYTSIWKTIVLEENKELIKKNAYFKWENAGKPENKDLEFWLESEQDFLGSWLAPAYLLSSFIMETPRIKISDLIQRRFKISD